MYKKMIPAETFYRSELKARRHSTKNRRAVNPNGRLRAAAAVAITETDARRLERLLEEMRFSREDLTTLRREIQSANVVPSKAIGSDVITMNSRARLRDLETGETMTYTLVFPERAKVEESKISVLAPIGTAMLGQKKGDEFSWPIPAGEVRLRVEEVVYQPEAAGHYQL